MPNFFVYRGGVRCEGETACVTKKLHGLPSLALAPRSWLLTA
jgi:hypothetical protein